MPSSILNPMVGKMEITSEVYDEVMSSVDKQLIVRALETSGGRIREAARRLGLARNTLKSKIQKFHPLGVAGGFVDEWISRLGNTRVVRLS